MNDKKRAATSDKDIIVYPNGIHYFRRGSKEISLKTAIFKEAVQAKRNLIAKGGDILSSSIRLRIRDVASDYLVARKKDLASGGIRESTFIHSEKCMSVITKFFGSVAVVKMDSMIWDADRHKIKGNHVVNVRSVFSHFMKWCVKRRFRTTLPIFDVGPIVRRKRRILTPQEIQAIWFHSSGSLKIFIAHALFLGMRRSEIMTLEWSQINFVERALFLPAIKTKTKNDRWVTLPPLVLELLSARKAAQIAEEVTTGWVFPHLESPKKAADKGGLKTSWQTCLRRAFSVAKGEPLPNITWHDLRATCEVYAHKRTDLSATQLEKFFGASVDVQRKTYVQGDANFVRGVEDSLLLTDMTKEKSAVGKTRGEEK